jgi:hypothetical protein
MNQSAFPWMVDDGKTVTGNKGMTLRDYFAAKAMQAILPTYNTVDVFDDQTGDDDDPSFPELIAIDSYLMADAMLKAREA